MIQFLTDVAFLITVFCAETAHEVAMESDDVTAQRAYACQKSWVRTRMRYEGILGHGHDIRPARRF